MEKYKNAYQTNDYVERFVCDYYAYLINTDNHNPFMTQRAKDKRADNANDIMHDYCAGLITVNETMGLLAQTFGGFTTC